MDGAEKVSRKTLVFLKHPVQRKYAHRFPKCTIPCLQNRRRRARRWHVYGHRRDRTACPSGWKATTAGSLTVNCVFTVPVRKDYYNCGWYAFAWQIEWSRSNCPADCLTDSLSTVLRKTPCERRHSAGTSAIPFLSIPQ